MKQKRPLKIKMINVSIEKDKMPDYKDIQLLQKFMTERGKIIGRVRTGITAKQQRALTKAIKHARHVALLPFIVRG
jgi:small subunit ribosomal protein S18